MKENMMFDVVVIGGGISGIVMTSLLAKEGYKVCLVEKEKELGGCIFSINKNGHNLQGGAHHIGGLGDGECVRRILKSLDIYDESDFISNKPLKGVIENEEFFIPFEISSLKSELISLFKNEYNNLIKFFSEVESFKSALINNDNMMIFRYFQKWSRITFSDLLNIYFTNNKLKTYLCGLGPGYGGITASGSAFTMMSLLTTYGEGAFNVKGGMDKLIKKLENYIISKDNATIYKESIVDNLIIDNEKVVAVEIKTKDEITEIKGEKIIATSNIKNIYKMVNSNINNKRFLNKINSLNIGPSVLRLFMSFNNKYSNEFDKVFLPSWNIEEWDEHLLYDTNKFKQGIKPISMVTFPTELDSNLCNNKEQSHMFMTILTKPKYINETKEEIKSNLKNMFYSSYNDCLQYENWDYIITNLDIENKTLSEEGSVFGWERGIKEVVNSNIFGGKCIFKNLYVAGNWGPSFGVYGAFYSAENVIKEIECNK